MQEREAALSNWTKRDYSKQYSFQIEKLLFAENTICF